MTATTATRPDLRWEFLETLAGVMIGCLLLAVLFAWVLVDSYQSMHLPITPLPLRIMIAMTLWAAVAAALAWLRPESSWRWGVRLALPAVMVRFGVVSSFAQFFGGTSLLIMVGVALDTLQQVESHLLMRHYDGFMKSGKMKGRLR